MIPTAATNPAPTPSSAMIGIASMILEGRALSDDEFNIELSSSKFSLKNNLQKQQNDVTEVNGASSSSSSSSSSTSSADPTIQHFQRIRQKLGQLRQSSPGTSRDHLVAEQEIVVGGAPNDIVGGGRDEYEKETSKSAHSLKHDQNSEKVLYTGQRRQKFQACSSASSSSTGGGVGAMSSIGCADTSSSSNSPTNISSNSNSGNSNNGSNINGGVSDGNILYTLQSLASTCLRTTPRNFTKNRDPLPTDYWFNNNSNNSSSSNNGASGTSAISNDSSIIVANAKVVPTPIFIGVGTACNSSNSNNNNNNSNGSNMGNNNGTGNNSVRNSSSSSNISNINSQQPLPTIFVNQKTTKNQAININKLNSKVKKITSPKQGPHCDQFLKKIGLSKSNDSSCEIEEHICDMANLNEICYRWQIHCRQMEVIMSKTDPICIEVYLGPENHEILLEQWIIKKHGERPIGIQTMTVQSLCNAIRSQLYFSQITAWSDLIRKAAPFDKDIIENGRIRCKSCKNDRATGGHLVAQKRPHLDIFYRIKSYDSTASFNSKPNIHNFPNIVISENCSISVCLKSLPRLHGGIPKIEEHLGSSSTSPCSVVPSAASCNNSNSNSNNSIGGSGNFDTTSSSSSSSSSSIGPSSVNRMMLNDSNKSEESRHEDTIMLNDRLLEFPCQEKGKHKCAFDEEDGSSDTTGGDNLCSAESGMSHREKQLLKYRKRMMKRDKKNKKDPSSTSSPIKILDSKKANAQEHNQTRDNRHINFMETSPVQFSSSTVEFSSPIATLTNAITSANVSASIPMPITSPTCTTINHHQQQNSIHEFGSINSINSIRPPLYQTTTSVAESVQTNSVEMISIGTQTVNFPPSTYPPVCQDCGHNMQLFCWNCDHNRSASVSGATCSMDTDKPKPRQGDILLQAIERTLTRISGNSTSNSSTPLQTTSSALFNRNQTNGGCQVCKRQKTGHHYSNANTNSPARTEISYHRDESNEEIVSKKKENVSNRYLYENAPENKMITDSEAGEQQGINASQESTSSSLLKIDDKCGCDTTISKRQNMINMETNGNDHCCYNGKKETPKKSSSTSERKLNSLMPSSNISAQFQTPKSNQSPQEVGSSRNPLKSSREFQNNLHLDCDLMNPSCSNEERTRHLPIVNLNNIFCNPFSTSPLSVNENRHRLKSIQQHLIKSSDVHFNTVEENNIATRQRRQQNSSSYSMDDGSNVLPDIPVQKSNSAPTLPNSPSLSPRFLKQAAIYKRRSRHLSDRSSERSSFGSDEQFSDEDLDSAYSPATSPIKSRIFPRLNLFGRRPLLGNIEESLLQKRFMPKTQVAGFKVLLGASGGFCPTQLTIPAAAYFYELEGYSLNTPYVCDIRLPRKGYTIPRTGTVQATLLNPLGTVVRMFVIPYDLRDMPPMSQTFIRQRILAVDSSSITYSTEITKQCNSSSMNNNNDIDNSGNNKIDGDGNNNNRNHTDISKSSSSTSSVSNSNRSATQNGMEIPFSEQMKHLRYSIHLRFQTTRSGRLALHTDIRFLISRRTDCDTAAAHAKGALESPNDLRILTISPDNPKYSARQENNLHKI